MLWRGVVCHSRNIGGCNLSDLLLDTLFAVAGADNKYCTEE